MSASLAMLIRRRAGRLVAWFRSDAVRVWRAVFLLLALLAVIWMLASPKPWTLVERLQEDRPRLGDVVRFWSWWAALFNTGVLLVLAWICPWWVRALPRTPPSGPRTPRWFVPLAVLAMVVMAGSGLQRMDHSFWVDEDFSVRDVIVGHYRVVEGELQYRPRKWEHTLYEYETPNNHVLFSVLARVCVDIWRSLARPEGLPYTEWPLRIPALMAGMGAVLALAWCLKAAGMPGAGIIAAFLAAFHPWFIRFSSEARGFSFVLLFVPLLLLAWQGAWRTGRWQWWGLFALSQFGLLYVFPAAVYVLLVMNAGALALFLLPGQRPQSARLLWSRWFVANCFAAGAVIQLMLPLLPQMQKYLGQSIAQGGMPWRWVQNFLSHIFAGVPWSYTRADTSDYPELWPEIVRNPILGWGVLAAGILLISAGFVRLAFAGRAQAVVAAVLLLPAPIAFGIAVWQGQYLFDRYLMPLLPGALIFAGTGIAWAANSLRGLRGGVVVAPAAAVLAVAVYALFTQPGRQILLERPYNPIRESVLLTLPSLDPQDPRRTGVITASFSFPPLVYDPWVERVATPDDLLALLREADNRGVPLFVNIGNPWSAQTFSPELFAMFNDPVLFEPPVRLLGFESTVDRMVARYRSGAVDRAR